MAQEREGQCRAGRRHKRDGGALLAGPNGPQRWELDEKEGEKEKSHLYESPNCVELL